VPTPLVCLIDPLTELEQYGLSYEFLQQFAPRPVEVQVTTGGVLGAMQIAWRFLGAVNYGDPKKSTSGSTWAPRLSDVYADVTFPAGTYVQGAVYVIDEAGAVTTPGGSPAITAARFDLRKTITKSVSDEALARMSVEPPVFAVGDDVKGAVGRIAAYELKSVLGLAPTGAAIGDENLLVRATQARQYLDDIGARKITTPGLVDSSDEAAVGAGLFDAESDEPRGW
jgi:hypothetical protein